MPITAIISEIEGTTFYQTSVIGPLDYIGTSSALGCSQIKGGSVSCCGNVSDEGYSALSQISFIGMFDGASSQISDNIFGEIWRIGMIIAAISSEIFANTEYQSSKIGNLEAYNGPYLPNYAGIISEIDCDLIWDSSLSNLGDTNDDVDYAVSHISSIGKDHGLVNCIGLGEFSTVSHIEN